MKANSHITGFPTFNSLVKGFLTSILAVSMASSIQAQSDAFSLDGIDDCVQISSNMVVVPMTMELWFKADASSTSDQYLITSAKSNKNDWYTGMYIGSSTGTTPGSLCFIDTKNGVVKTMNSSSSITFGEWNHAAVVVNGTSQFLYLNGELVDSDSFTPSTMNSHNRVGVGFAYTKNPFGYFDGNISDIRVWASDLDSNTVRDWMHQTIDNTHPNLANLAVYFTGSSTINGASSLGSTNSNSSTNGTFSGASAVQTTSSNLPKPYTTNADGQWNAASTWPAGMGKPKSIYNKVIIDHNISMSNDAAIGTLTVNSGASIDINSNVTLEVNEGIVNNGTVTIEDRAALVQYEATSTNTGIGTYVVKRKGKTNSVAYNIWSSPIESADTTMLNGTTVIYFYNPVTHAWYKKLDIAQGEGVFARGNSTGERTFTGTVNNGTVSIALEEHNGTLQNFNLVGNPYPCAIDADEFLQLNAIDNNRINGTLYFWDDDNSGGNGNYSSNDYATYTTLGGTSATGGGVGNAPSGVIGSHQGFFVEAVSASTLEFTNSMRIAGNNNQFFKGASDDKSLVWLNLENGSDDGFNQILVGIDDNATIGYDAAIDAKKNQGNSNISFASMLGSTKLAIQGLPRLQGFETHSIALEVFTSTVGKHKIAIDHTQNFDGYYIELEDKVTGHRASLINNPYKFTVDQPTRTSSRFVLHIFKMKAELDNNSNTSLTDANEGARDFSMLEGYANEDNSTNGQIDQVTAFGGVQTVNVQSNASSALNIELVDMNGRTLRTKRIDANGIIRFENVASGLYLIKYNSANQQQVEKVIVH